MEYCISNISHTCVVCLKWLSVVPSVDQRLVFEDSNTYYQFSFEECDAQGCEFRSEEEWQNGVRLLLQLVPYVQFRHGCVFSVSLAVTVMSWDCGLKYLFSLQQAGVCTLRTPDDFSRLEMVQKLAKDGYRFLQNQNYRLPDRSAQVGQPSLAPEPVGMVTAGQGSHEKVRYVVVSGTPQKILEHLLSDLRLDEQQGATEKMLLDDFLLTYLVFMSTSELCQALLGQYPSDRKEEGKEALYRKRKVLHLVSQWSTLYKDFLREEENVKPFMKTLYRYVLEDVYEFPMLEKDLKEFQKLLRRRHLKENCAPLRASPVESKDGNTAVFSCLVLQSYTDPVLCLSEKRVLQPHDSIYSESLMAPSRLIACRRDLSEILPPLTECPDLGQKPVRLLGINTWDVAVALTNFDWNLFNSIHEQELIFYTFSGQASSGHTVALELLLRRCNEVQQWVMSEVLLCPSLSKRVQLLKKFIKIAAHCKAQRNLNSSFAIIMGLNTAAVSRLNQTWEVKALSTHDPSMNHKAYRDAFKKMKPPKIPFMPLLLKDITFIHEGNKTFHDNLVNFEKLHMIADTVRLIRHCQTDQTGNELSPCDSPEVRSSIHYLHIIDNQQTLFELSHRLEPRV
uniref:Rap guanine nucleotide exchange factor (GEF) 5a n=1 Tax=Cyprinus carpio TaxID=7962 RepID=A0A8C1YN84_CYPCA